MEQDKTKGEPLETTPLNSTEEGGGTKTPPSSPESSDSPPEMPSEVPASTTGGEVQLPATTATEEGVTSQPNGKAEPLVCNEHTNS